MSDQEQKEGGEIALIGTLSDGSRGKRDVIENMVSTRHVRNKFQQFMGQLQEIINVDLPVATGFELDQVQFSAEITAKGDFKLLGTGVGLETKSGVVFTLKRKA